jgi:hypothetical protein
MAGSPYTRPKTVINVPKLYTHSEPRFHARLSEGASEMQLALG